MLKGDIAKFSPADLLAFLAHLNREGVLSVTRGNDGLSISFKDGVLVDANSEQADGMVLRALLMHNLIDKSQFDRVSQARRETGLPLRQILEDVEALPVSEVGNVLRDGVREVLFQLFLWESGEFNFIEIAVDRCAGQESYDCHGLTLEITTQVDEYREIIANIVSADRVVTLTSSGRAAAAASAPTRFVLGQAGKRKPVHAIVAAAPFTSFEIMKALQGSLARGWIELGQNGQGGEAAVADSHSPARSFTSYKRSLKRMISSKQTRAKVKELVNFCKDHFDYSLLIASRQGKAVRFMRFSRNAEGQLERSPMREVHVDITDDPTFNLACDSGFPFFGTLLSSNLLAGCGEQPPDGECAIVPLGVIDDQNYLIYAVAARDLEVPGPFHYLELLSWHIHPPAEEARGVAPSVPEDEASSEAARRGEGASPSEDGMSRIVEKVHELPPMPGNVTRILQLLSDPDSKMADLADILSCDQALVARLIKISNSALYSRGQKTSTVSQAVVKLGTRAVRSLVLAASTRSLFPVNQTNVGIWGQALWQHSIECGLASRRVAELAGYGDPDEAFVGGVLHDIGKVVILLNLPDEFRVIRRNQNSAKMSSTEAERVVLGFDHTQVGQLLLEKWQMPRRLKACVRYHHSPQKAEEFDTLVRIVACGDCLSHRHGSQADEARGDSSLDVPSVAEQLALSDETVSALEDGTIPLFEHIDILD